MKSHEHVSKLFATSSRDFFTCEAYEEEQERCTEEREKVRNGSMRSFFGGSTKITSSPHTYLTGEKSSTMLIGKTIGEKEKRRRYVGGKEAKCKQG